MAEHEVVRSCDELEPIGAVGLDEVSALGAVPSDVLARVHRPVGGTLEFLDDVTPPAPADLVVTFVPSGDAVDYAEAAAPQHDWSCGVPHLRMVGALQLEVVRRDSAPPLVMVDPDAFVLAYGPGDAVAIEAEHENVPFPDWLQAVAETEPQFADPADYRTDASLVPWGEEGGGAYFWDILESSFSVGASNTRAVHGKWLASELMGFRPDQPEP